MKKKFAALLLFATLIFTMGASAREPLITKAQGFTGPGAGVPINLALLFPSFQEFTWGPTSGSVTTCSVVMEQSVDGIVWTNLVPAKDCTVKGSAKRITSNASFIRSRVITLTGGTIGIVYKGFDGASCGLQYNGIMDTVNSGDPAAGAEVLVSIPAGERWKVSAIHFELVTNNTQGDRSVFFSIDDGTNEYFRTFADGLVQADQTGIYTASALGFVGTVGLGPSSVHLPVDVRTILIPLQGNNFLPGGYNIRTDTDGLQPGDNYGPVTLLVEKCPN